MKLSVYLLVWLISYSTFTYATHLKGAELTARRTSDTSPAYTFSLILYEVNSGVSQNAAKLSFGDGLEGELTLQSATVVSEGITRKVFTGSHTFAAPGIYTVSFDGNNRNAAVNIEDALNTKLYIELSLLINQNAGVDNSPVFKHAPQFFAKAGEKFTDNYEASDAEADSLVYSLVAPIGAVNYVNPAQVGGASNSTFRVDAVTGVLTWDVPKYIGNYVFVVKVEEWRKGIKLGFVLRDIQITVTSNNPNDLPPSNPPTSGIPPQQPEEGKQFLLFPNPASGQVYIHLPVVYESQRAEIWSPKGQLLKTKQLPAMEETNTLDLRELPRGIYLVKIFTTSGHFTRKLVLMH